MEPLSRGLWLYLLVLQLLAAFVTVDDKRRARKHRRRRSEKSLWCIAALGGAGGMWLTMRLVRHKTLHRRFMLGLPALFLLQLALLWAVFHPELVATLLPLPPIEPRSAAFAAIAAPRGQKILAFVPYI